MYFQRSLAEMKFTTKKDELAGVWFKLQAKNSTAFC